MTKDHSLLQTPSGEPALPPFSLAPGRGADAAQMARLDRSLWDDWANPLTLYRQLMDIFPEATLVARDQNAALIGYAVGFSNGYTREGWVLCIDIHPEWQGKGVGRAMLGRLLETFQANAIRQVSAVIAPGNIPSQRLFHSFGFELTQLEPDYFGLGKTQERWHFKASYP